jgi:hypothetical protein
MAEADNVAPAEIVDLGKSIMSAVQAMRLDPRNHDTDDGTLVWSAAHKAFQAAKKGERVPPPPPDTYSVATVFPGIEKELDQVMGEAWTKTMTAENKAATVPFTRARHKHVHAVIHNLFSLAMQKIAVVGYHCKHDGPISNWEQMKPLLAHISEQNKQIRQFHEHIDALETRLGARIDSLTEEIYGTVDGQ